MKVINECGRFIRFVVVERPILQSMCAVCVRAVADMQRPCRLPAKSEVAAQCGGMRDTRETNELRTVM